MARTLFCALLVLFSFPALSEAQLVGEVLSGEATPIEGVPEPALQRISFEMERCGPLFRTTWRDANGKVLAADELEVADGVFSRYRLVRPNVDEWARMTRDGAALRIEHSAGGRVRTGELPGVRALLVGPMIALTAERHLQDLVGGERLRIRFAVAEKLAAFDFTVTGHVSNGGGRNVEVIADSWVVRQFAKPVSLYFTADGQFTGMRGRALPASGAPGRSKPLELDARVLGRAARKCSTEPRNEDWFRARS